MSQPRPGRLSAGNEVSTVHSICRDPGSLAGTRATAAHPRASTGAGAHSTDGDGMNRSKAPVQGCSTGLQGRQHRRLGSHLIWLPASLSYRAEGKH